MSSDWLKSTSWYFVSRKRWQQWTLISELQGVLQEDMGYGRRGDEESTALKACTGVTMPSSVAGRASGWDRAVKRSWVNGSGDGSSMTLLPRARRLGFSKERCRARDLHSSATSLDDWGYGASRLVGCGGWPARGRACGRFDPGGGRREAARDYLRSNDIRRYTQRCHDSVGQQPARLDGPILVTRAGDLGCRRGGYRWAGQCNGGLLQRRRGCFAEAQSVADGMHRRRKQRRERYWRRDRSCASRAGNSRNRCVMPKCRDFR